MKDDMEFNPKCIVELMEECEANEPAFATLAAQLKRKNMPPSVVEPFDDGRDFVRRAVHLEDGYRYGQTADGTLWGKDPSSPHYYESGAYDDIDQALRESAEAEHGLLVECDENWKPKRSGRTKKKTIRQAEKRSNMSKQVPVPSTACESEPKPKTVKVGSMPAAAYFLCGGDLCFKTTRTVPDEDGVQRIVVVRMSCGNTGHFEPDADVILCDRDGKPEMQSASSAKAKLKELPAGTIYLKKNTKGEVIDCYRVVKNGVNWMWTTLVSGERDVTRWSHEGLDDVVEVVGEMSLNSALVK